MGSKSANVHRRKTNQEATARMRRRFVVKVRMSADELAALDAYAEGLGVDRSKALRRIPTKDNGGCSAGNQVAALSEIVAGLNAIKRSSAGIGNNVNQLARAANSRERREPGSVGDFVMNGLFQDALREVAEAIEQQNAVILELSAKLEGML